MGGRDRVFAQASQALEAGDFRWALHLLAKLEDSGLCEEGKKEELEEARARGYEGLASTLVNLNGRGYLLECAHEIRHGSEKTPRARLDENVVAAIPLDAIFAVMATKLIPGRAMDVHESVVYEFTDEHRQFVVTVRRGIAEIVEGDPLPQTPPPIATVTTDALTFRRIAAKVTTPLAALASGRLKVKGSWTGFLAFSRRFELD